MQSEGQMPLQRPFRRRRKVAFVEEMEASESRLGQSPDALASSAIASRLPSHYDHLDHQQSDITTPSDAATTTATTTIPIAQVTHKHTRQDQHQHQHSHSLRYSCSRAAGRTRGASGGRRTKSLLPAGSFSLPMLMSLSLVACVIMSLLNLTTTTISSSSNNQMQPRNMFVMAVAGSATSKSTSSALTTAAQQQFNSVIQYPSSTGTTTTTTAMKARYKTMYACEDRQLTMDCESGFKINLIRANFGRFSITQCNEQGQLDLSTDCMSPITFRIMQERCQDKQNCSVNATSSLFGDRCPKTRKYLEVHFQCLLDMDTVNVRDQRPSQSSSASSSYSHNAGPLNTSNLGELKPPNNPTMAQPSTPHFADGPSYSDMPASPVAAAPAQPPTSSDTYRPASQQPPTPVINSQIMNSKMAMEQSNDITSNLAAAAADFGGQIAREPIVVSMRHVQLANMSRPRCYQWDATIDQWTDRGARILQTNLTHTICAFDQVTSYVLVMDYSGPMPTISMPSQTAETHAVNQAPYANPLLQSGPDQDLLKMQPVPLDAYAQQTSPMVHAPNQPFDPSKMLQHPPTPGQQQQQQSSSSSSSKLFTLFGYLLGIIVVAVALMTLTLIATSMRATAGAAFKSLGNFVPFGGPNNKYKNRRQDLGAGPPNNNKNLLVVTNNSNGHQFIYAPASTTKISSSSSTHILSASGNGQSQNGGPYQGTLHRLQQQQLYSGNGATLSSLSGTGAQSNNYYYGLNPLFQAQQHHQQQQQQHHFSQHHLNQQQQQQLPQLAHGQGQAGTTSYNHQANKSTMSNESANSSASSSGVESGSTSMQQQQQQQQHPQHHLQQTQQACLVSAMNNNDFNLMGHHLSNYGRHPQQQQQNLFATMKNSPSHFGATQQHQPTLTVNAHYLTSAGGATATMQPLNMTPNQAAAAAMLHQRQASSQMRDHIYECVDDDKTYMARLLMPTNSQQAQQQQQQHEQQQQDQQALHLQQGQPQQAFSTWRDTLRHKCVALPVPKVV